MSFVFYDSLTDSAKKAFDKGNGRHGKFMVDGDYITVIFKDKKMGQWHKVIKSTGEPIVEQK